MRETASRLLGYVGFAVVPFLLLALTGCNSGSSSKQETPLDLGLDGTWTGLLNGLGDVAPTVVFTIEADRIERVTIDGGTTGETGQIAEIDEALYAFAFEPVLPRGLSPRTFSVPSGTSQGFGRMVVSPDLGHLLVVGNAGQFGILQRGEPAIGQASLLDVIGEWRGSVRGQIFAALESVYAYRTSGTCALDTCVFTALEPATFPDGRFVPLVDGNGQVVFDITGAQSTMTVVPRDRLLFDFTYTSTLGVAGDGVLAMSPDKNLLGGVVCPTGVPFPNCEMGFLFKD